MRTKRIARTSPGLTASRVGREDPKAQLAELGRVDRSRRVGHRLLRLLVLGERDHVADVLGAEPLHDHAIDAPRPPAVRWHAVLERLEQEAELPSGLVGIDAQGGEDALLDRGVGDADAPAADLPAVDDQVVGARAHREWILLEQVEIVAWTIVNGWWAALISPVSLAAFEHRELGRPTACRCEHRRRAARPAEMVAERAERGVDHRRAGRPP